MKLFIVYSELKEGDYLYVRGPYGESPDVVRRRDIVLVGGGCGIAGIYFFAKQFLDIGFTLSFTGVLTFTHDYDEVVKNPPLDMLLPETDAPYVTPVPHRGKRNEPLYVQEVVRAIARIRGEDLEKVAEQLMRNAERVFNIKDIASDVSDSYSQP